MSYTIENNGASWDIKTTLPGVPLVGGPKNTCTATIDVDGTVKIQQGNETIFTQPISNIAGLAAGTELIQFKDLVNTFLSNLSSAISSIVAGSGISITNVGGAYTITNSLPFQSGSVAAGSNIGVSFSGGVATVSNSAPTQQLTAGAGIGISTTLNNSTITNTGVTTPYSAGTGINITGSTITNTGVNTLTGGNGITVGGTSTNPTLSANLTAGTNVTFTGVSPNIIINAAGSSFNGQTLAQYWVNGSGGSDSNPGSPVAPFLTINKALNTIVANADSSSTKLYTVIIAGGQYSDNISLPPWVFLSGLTDGLPAILGGSFAINSAQWIAAGFGAYGGYGRLSMNPVTLDFTGMAAIFPTIYVFDIPTVGGPLTVTGITQSTVNIRNSELFSLTGTGGTYQLYGNRLGASTIHSATGNNAVVRIASLAMGGALTLDSASGGTLTAYLGSVAFYASSALNIAGASTIVTGSINSIPEAGPTFSSGAVDGTNFLLNNQAVRQILAGTGISITAPAVHSGKPTVVNTGVTSLIAGSGITVSAATGAVTVSASGGGGGGSNINLTAFVDGVNGNNATAVLGDITHPYNTIAAAYTAITGTYTLGPGSQGVIFILPGIGVFGAGAIIPRSYITYTAFSPDSTIFQATSLTDATQPVYLNCFIDNIGFQGSQTLTLAGTSRTSPNAVTFTNCIFSAQSAASYILTVGANFQNFSFTNCTFNNMSIRIGDSSDSTYYFSKNLIITDDNAQSQPVYISSGSGANYSQVFFTKNEFRAICMTGGSAGQNYVPYYFPGPVDENWLSVQLTDNTYYFDYAYHSHGNANYGYINNTPLDSVNRPINAQIVSTNETMVVNSEIGYVTPTGTFTFIQQSASANSYSKIFISGFKLNLQNSSFASATYWGNNNALPNCRIMDCSFDGMYRLYTSVIANSGNQFLSYNITDEGKQYSNYSNATNTVFMDAPNTDTYTIDPINMDGGNGNCVFLRSATNTVNFTGAVSEYGNQQFYFYTGTASTLAISVTAPFVFHASSTATNLVPANSLLVVNISNSIGVGAIATKFITQGL